MVQLKLVSKDQEQKLLGAMESAITDSNNGIDVNASIAKQARDNGFSPEFTARMVEAYNTSKTIHHLRTTDGEKRAETFSLADLGKVMSELYTAEPSKVKQAMVLEHVSLDKLSDELYGTTVTREYLEKVAKHLTKTVVGPQIGLPENIIKRADGMLSDIGWARKELSMEAAFAKEAAMNGIKGFVESFKYADDDADFDDIEARVVSQWGNIGKQAMDMAWNMHDFEGEGEQRAVKFPRGIQKLGSSRRHRAAADMLSAVEKAGEAAVKLLQFNKTASVVERYVNGSLEKIGVKQTDEAADDFSKQIMSALGVNDPATTKQQAAFDSAKHRAVSSYYSDEGLLNDPAYTQNAQLLRPLSAPPVAVGSDVTQANLGAPPAGIPMNNVMSQDIAQGLTEELRSRGVNDKEIDGALKSMIVDSPYYMQPDARRKVKAQQDAEEVRLISQIVSGQSPLMPAGLVDLISDTPAEVAPVISPEHEGEIRKVRMQLMVNDMISNDAVLSAYAPEDVMRVVNQLAEEIPSLSTSPLLMRGMVSRVLQQGGHLDPAEVEQLLKAERVKRETGYKGY